MNWDLEAISKIAIGAVPALATLAGFFRGPNKPRRQLARDIKLHDALPENNPGRQTMADWIAQQIENLRTFEADATRNYQGAVISFILTIAFGAGTFWLIDAGEWWSYILASITTLFALVGVTEVFDDSQLARRDAKGKRLPE